MTSLIIKKTVLRGTRSTHGGVLAIRRVVDTLVPVAKISKGLDRKLFGISILAVILAWVFRSIFGGKSLNAFESNWNKDSYYGVLVGYRKKITYALLSRNILRFGTQGVLDLVIGTIKTLQDQGKVSLHRVAIDSTKLVAHGSNYQKTGWTKIKGQYVQGYKFTLAFDIESKLPLTYIVTPLHVHESQVVIDLLTVLKSRYGKYPRELVVDRGFFASKLFKFCDAHKITFIIPAKRYSLFKKLVAEADPKDFTTHGYGKHTLRFKTVSYTIKTYRTKC